MIGRTFTKSFTVETRQHELLGLDLGEGPTRQSLLFGGAILAIWFGLMWLILGPPNRLTFMLYVTVPALIVFYGFQDSRRLPRRKNFAEWVLKAHYQLHGHKPVIGLETRPPMRGEGRPISARLGLANLGKILAPWNPPPQPWERQSTALEAHPAGRGRNIVLRRDGRLYGFEWMNQKVRKIRKETGSV